MKTFKDYDFDVFKYEIIPIFDMELPVVFEISIMFWENY